MNDVSRERTLALKLWNVRIMQSHEQKNDLEEKNICGSYLETGSGGTGRTGLPTPLERTMKLAEANWKN